MKNEMTSLRNKFLAGTILCAVFAAVYEHFSHQVYSNFMIFAFAIPLIGGVLPYTIAGFVFREDLPRIWPRTFYNCGIITLTVGSIYQGIIEIYGTTSRLAIVYPVAGGILLGAALISYILSFARKTKNNRTEIPIAIALDQGFDYN